MVSNAVLPMFRAIMSNRAGYLRMRGRLVGQVRRGFLLTVTENCLLTSTLQVIGDGPSCYGT